MRAHDASGYIDSSAEAPLDEPLRVKRPGSRPPEWLPVERG